MIRTTPNLPLVLLGVSLFHPHCSPLQVKGAIKDPEPQNAISAVLAAFDRYDLVALGEAHRNQNVHDFALSLIRSADFPRKVNDIVVEFGNGRYQSMMDRYVDGADVSSRELRRVWRDAVNILVWDAPVYERFFAVTREVNQHLPKVRRIRVLLGDPAFDWDQIKTKEQWEKIAAQRDTHAVDVIVKEVVQKRRKALLVFGSQHLTRESAYLAFGGKAWAPNVTETLEHEYAESFRHLAGDDRMGRDKRKLWASCALAVPIDRAGQGYMAGRKDIRCSRCGYQAPGVGGRLPLSWAGAFVEAVRPAYETLS